MHQPYFEDVLRLLARWLAPFIPPKSPQRPKLTITGQKDSATMIITATAPAQTSADFDHATLYYKIDGGTEVTVEFGGAEFVTFTAPVDSTVTAQLTVTDKSGNTSERSEETLLSVTDTIAPPAPAAPVIAVTGEE